MDPKRERHAGTGAEEEKEKEKTGLSDAPAVPVVLIHGALRGRLGLQPTAAALRRAGFEPRVFSYRTRTETLDRHAEKLEAFIDDWLGPRAPVPILGLLTHSMGGLVARAYFSRPGSRGQSIRQRLVMLAPPNQGSSLAAQHKDNPWFRALYGVAGDELLPERVRELPVPPPTCATLVLVGGRGDVRGFNPALPGDDDGVVASRETELDSADRETVLGVHTLLQWRGTVLARAAQFLAGGPDTRSDEGARGEAPSKPEESGAEGQT